MQVQITWTEPILCHYKHDLKRNWFICFWVHNKTTGQKKKMQFRGKINDHKDKKNRTREAAGLMGYWKKRLVEGWHPWQEDQAEKPIYPQTPFCDALDFAYSKLKTAKKTKDNYRVTLNFVKAAAQKVGLARKRISEVSKADVKLIFEQISKDRKWSNKSYNKHVGYLGGILSQLDEWEVMPVNPAHKIKPLPVAETEKYVPLTESEKAIIRDHLTKYHPRFFVFVSVLYATGIRPKEILALKIKDVNLTRGEITILPDLEAENSKTKSIRKVPIDKHLLPLLQSLNLGECPPDHYVFGSPFEHGMGNRGSSKEGRGARHPDYFKPSTTMIKRDTVTKFWHRIVIKGLGIKKFLYSLKHTGSDDKLLAGIDVETLKELYGHSSNRMTQKYLTKLQEVAAKKIKEHSPGL